MKKTMYLECQSGISGDMTVAALLDLGADEEVLKKALSSLPVSGFQIQISRVKKAGLDVCDFDVLLDKVHENHDHDMEYLHGHSHEHSHNHSAHAHHHHVHRGMKEIMDILNAAALTDRARATAVRIFTILGEAEAKAHGTTLEEVHFHEVGAVDSIVDIVSVAVCLDNLGIEEVIVPEICEGSEWPEPSSDRRRRRIYYAYRGSDCSGGGNFPDPSGIFYNQKNRSWCRKEGV